MIENPPTGTQRVTVRIAYENPQQAVDFLDRAFGFAEREGSRLEGPNQTIIVTEIAIGDAYVMIGPAGSHAIASPCQVGASTESLMVYVDHIDDHFERARANGARIISPPGDQYWGDRRYECKDPEGHLWIFHERTRQVSPEEIANIEATFKNG